MNGVGLRTEARFPAVPERNGHYESFYIKASRPGGGRSFWIRHTVHKRPGELPTAALWVTLFDADADAAGPRATKQTFTAQELSAPSGAYIQVGDAILEPGRASGSAGSDSLAASWDLTFADESEPLRHLPREFLYRTRLPRTKLLSPYPCATYDGTLRVGDESIEVAGWPGMIGHNWGAEHAERWVWMQASNLGGNETDYIDIAAGRVKVGPLTTPWIANGRVVIGGEAHRLGGFRGSYGTELNEEPNSCEFTIAGKNVNVTGRVSAPAKDFVGWVYADPKGPEHNVVNCSVADLELKIERPGERHARLVVAGAAAYELGMRETDHGVPLQPYPDG